MCANVSIKPLIQKLKLLLKYLNEWTRMHLISCEVKILFLLDGDVKGYEIDIIMRQTKTQFV